MPTASVIPIATKAYIVYSARVTSSGSHESLSNSPSVRKPGKMPEIDASTAQKL
jgi:ABC-type lipopolysaccharide export system ATPase subunit